MPIKVDTCPHQSSVCLCARLASAAAKSIWPTAAGFVIFAFGTAVPLGGGLGAVGIGGLPGGLVAPGFAATGGGITFGFVATGGGGLAFSALEGLELVGVVFAESLVGAAGFFQGVAEPLEGASPGKTATGLADASAITDLTAGVIFGAAAVASAAGVDGGRRRAGGGGAAGGALGFLGTSSR